MHVCRSGGGGGGANRPMSSGPSFPNSALSLRLNSHHAVCVCVCVFTGGGVGGEVCVFVCSTLCIFVSQFVCVCTRADDVV
jgi:hypothetical protein